MRAVVLAAWLATLATCPSAVGADKPAGLAPTKLQEVRRVVSAEMERLRIPGLSVAIAVDFKLAWTGGFGLADVENDVRATGETIYRLGSISKPITAVGVMQLYERGKLDLDAPIQRYVPAFPQKPWAITPRLLLAHLSGIRHYKAPAEINSTRHYEDLVAPLEIFKDEPLMYEPGTRFLYTTYGYNLLGAALEAASGMHFFDYLRQNIFIPAKMESIRPDQVYAVVPHRARGYRRTRSGTLENCALADTSNKVPGGGMISTAGDLVRFATTLEGGGLVKKSTLDQMFTPQRTKDGKATGYGLGFFILDRGGRHWVGHSGAQQGVSTLLMTLPAERVAVAVMANMEGRGLQPLVGQIAEIVLQ